MRRLLALLLPVAALATACPGTNQNLDLPKPDADDDITPDATLGESLPPQALKVMNWNTRNFYNDVRDSLEIDVANEQIETTLDYQAKLTDVAAVISSANPDVAILIEVENKAVLDDLGNKLGGYPHRAVSQGNDPRGIDIAVISKVPFQIGPSHKTDSFAASTTPGKNFKFARDVLEVHMMVRQRHVALYGVHFKAKDAGDPDADTKRLAEAERTRKIVTDALTKEPTIAAIVLGDFNDGPDSPPLVALRGTTPPVMTSSTLGLAAADRYSYTYAGTTDLIDDQIADPNAALLLDGPSVTIDHDVDNAITDHDPVIATYQVK